jgi:hypothetical protein
VGAPGSLGSEWIETIDVCPARRQGVDASLTGLPEEDSVLTPGMGVADQFELPPVQRVKRVRDTESLRIAAVISS